METTTTGRKIKFPAILRKKEDNYRILSFVLLILLVISVLTAGFRFEKAISKNKAAEKTIAYINTNMLPAGVSAELNSVARERNLYRIDFTISGEEYSSYVTRDGEILFPQGIPMELEDTTETETGTEEPVSCNDVPKNQKPIVELFVMPQCPYGSIAIKTMAPAYELLKKVADIGVYFIASDNKDGTFTSLYGQTEVDEDLRQVCVIKNYPDTYFNYLTCIADSYQSPETAWENCATKAKMDVTKIRTCSQGAEGKKLLSENIKKADSLNIGSSPTLLVNGQKYGGSRTPNAYKEFICCGLGVAAEECEGELSTTGATTSGSC